MTKKPHATPAPLNYALAERWLRAELTSLREQTGLTRIEVCRDTGISIRTLQRIENGPTPVAADNVAVLCQYYGATREHEKELQQLRLYSQKIGWWNEYKDVLGPVYAEHCEAEQQALQMDHCGMLIPGNLQTEAYAERVQAEGILANGGEIARRYVELRLRRQEEFLKEPRHRFRVLLELHGLRRPSLADVIEEQLKHLQRLQEQGYLELRVHPGPLMDFMHFTFGSPHQGKRQRLLACFNGSVDDVHDEDVHRVAQIKKYFHQAWENAGLLSEVSI